MRVGADRPTRSSSDHPRRRAAARRDLPRAGGAARPTTPRLIRERFPEIPRRVSGYNLRPAAAGERLPRRARAGRHAKAPASRCSRPALRLVPSPAEHAPARPRLPGRLRGRRPRPGDPGARSRSGWRASTDKLIDYMRTKGLQRRRPATCCRRASGWLLVEFGGETRAEADGARARAPHGRGCGRQGRSPGMRMLRRPAPAGGRSGRCARSGLGATACVPGQRDTWPGWEDARRAAGASSATTCATCASCCDDYELRRRRSTATSARAASTRRIDFDLRTPDGIAATTGASSTRPPTWSSAYGGSFSGEHGDGQARGELLPKMYGAELMRGVPRVQGDLGPGRTHEPG